MDISVHEDKVSLLRKAGNGGHAGKVSRREHHAGITPKKIGELFLQFEVNGTRTICESCTIGAASPAIEGGFPSGKNLRMPAKSEVIVAREHDHLAAITPDMSTIILFKRLIPETVFQPGLCGGVILDTADNGAALAIMFGEI